MQHKGYFLNPPSYLGNNCELYTSTIDCIVFTIQQILKGSHPYFTSGNIFSIQKRRDFDRIYIIV